jgi:hypothetical protein
MGASDDIAHDMDDGGMKISESGIGTQQRPQPGQKNFGVIKGEAYPPPAGNGLVSVVVKKGRFLSPPVSGVRIVTGFGAKGSSRPG